MILAYLLPDDVRHLSSGTISRLQPVIVSRPQAIKRPLITVESINRALNALGK